MSTVFITGAGGFLGRLVLDAMIAEGNTVRCIIRNPERAAAVRATGAIVTVGDLSRVDDVNAAIGDADIVVHAAGKLGGWGTRAEFVRDNVTATRNALSAAERVNVRHFIHVSSVAVYGLQPGRHITEDSPPQRDRDPYCQTKLHGEELVREFHQRTGIRTAIIRPAIIYGPGDLHMIPVILASMRAHAMLMVGPKHQGPPLVYGSDVVRLIMLLLLSQETPFEIYNLSSPEPVSWEDIVGTLAAATNLPSTMTRIPYRVAYAAGAVLEALWTLVHAKSPPMVTRFLAALVGVQYDFDSTRALAVPGFGTFTPLATGIAETLAATRH